jgi:hypothetical protein
MKRLFVLFFVIAISAGLYAQNSFFPSKVGMALTYADNDARGNAQTYSVITIKDVKGSGKNMTITYGANTLDKNRKPLKDSLGEQILQVTVKDDVVIMDLKHRIPTQMKGQGGVRIEAKGTPMELPNNLKPGQSLKNSEITMTFDMGIVKMNAVGRMTEGKCLAIEDIRVPAGTFKCHKITQKVTTIVANATVVETLISWYAPNIGTVKSETYDDQNKLVASSVLVEVKGQ